MNHGKPVFGAGRGGDSHAMVNVSCSVFWYYFKYYIKFCKLGVLLFLFCFCLVGLLYICVFKVKYFWEMCSNHVKIDNHPFWIMQRKFTHGPSKWKCCSTSSQKSHWDTASSLVIWTRGYSDFPSCKTSKSCSSCSEKWHVIIIMSFGFSKKQSATDVQLCFSGWAASGTDTEEGVDTL